MQDKEYTTTTQEWMQTQSPQRDGLLLTWLKCWKYSSASSVSLNLLSREGPMRGSFLREQEVLDR